MPAEILIFSRKNGRALRTYGVNRADRIMKSTFICFVVVLSCGYCTTGDMEIYPRVRFNFNDDRQYRLKKYEQPDFYAKYRFPFPLEEFRDSQNPYDSDNENLAERLNRLKNFEEAIDFERVQLMKQKHRAKADYKQHQYPLKVEVPNSFKPSNLLEEPRVYAQDDDFRFIIDDNEEGNVQDIIGQPKYTDEQDTNAPSTSQWKDVMKNAHMEGMDHNIEENDNEDDDDDTTRRFQGVKVIADPSDFAYAPSDPRFYRKTDVVRFEKAQTLEPINIDTPGRTINDTVSVTYRSEQKNQQMKMRHQEDDTSSSTHRIGEADVVAVKPSMADIDSAGVYVIAIVAGISAAATVGLIAVGIGWYNLQKHVKNASDVEYPAYGITGPNKDISPSGDRRLAQSAQMYHYQHQKQQIIAMESAQPSFAISRAQPGERHGSVSEADSDEENEEGDYTVYECPGLAPTGEMEVKNPLFQDDPTPAQTPAVKNTSDEKK